MSHLTQSHELPTGEANIKNPKPEEFEDTILPTDDPEKAAAYRISETEISPEQRKEEARIMPAKASKRP
jgi:hypothetical protein